MLFTNLSRIDLLHFLPKGGEAAEIGVAEGDFSRLILSHAAPRKLHLIDPWEHQQRDDYLPDVYGNPDATVQEDRFQRVSREFAGPVASGQVVLHRTYSSTALADFADGQFDWIYIDGLHTREGVLADLEGYRKKLKPDGLILGHDYTNHLPATNAGFGVVEAVNAFVRDSGFDFLALTRENYPTYVLSAEPQGERASLFIANILHFSNFVVDLPGYPAGFQYRHEALQVGEKVVVLPRFSAA